ncbi:MAG: hypothetical protein KatS3mg129_1106 [Leptospiraceae bacterium]|nr:MAG: hypothetical protein KatS3mg129_1106 [Leptospiraceae bacterium]
MKKIIFISIFGLLSCEFIGEKIQNFFGSNNFMTETLYNKYHEVVSDVGDLTDEKVKKYICAYRTLRNKTKDHTGYFQILQEVEGNPTKLMDVYKNMDEDVKKCGLKNMEEFVKLNSKIAWAWNIYQGQKGMKTFSNLQDNISNKSRKDMEQILSDPNIPEDMKKQFREQMEKSLQQAKEEYNKEFEKNKKWAEFALNIVKPLTNDHDIEVVKRHEQELMEVFTGLSPEQLREIHKYQAEALGIKE